MPARNLAAHTRTKYTKDLTNLVAFLTEHGVTRIADVSLRHLEAYQAALDHKGYASVVAVAKRKALQKQCAVSGVAAHPATRSYHAGMAPGLEDGMEDLQAELDRVRQELIATEEEYTKARAHGNRQNILALEDTLDRLNRELTDLLDRLDQTKE